MKTLLKAAGAVASAAALTVSIGGIAGASPATSGSATYYTDAGYGACGTQINASTDMLVAAPAALWTTPNPNNDPLCAQSIRVTYNGTTITVPIKDKCPTCDPGKIDLSLPAFQQLADPNLGIIQLDWEIQ
ncbi:cysteine/serine endopeptidase inhibitor [Amycolatopsis sp. NBC_01480]|jgi:expansin (peptidoglycan-binding protein)|uniref:cysteine/serine endopeptidase inhibitor n=1 Tax=Amycolatopsis sp. NBC_01480 TaxID=2903562 RepID=UPI002E290F3D|nr:cysteine/serine endopeptidase inhibitor [Amycolatopsis sp. NBC_01480]